MREIKFFLADKTPTREELEQCLTFQKENKDKYVVCLKWFVEYSGWYSIWFQNKETLEECERVIPKRYGM